MPMRLVDQRRVLRLPSGAERQSRTTAETNDNRKDKDMPLGRPRLDRIMVAVGIGALAMIMLATSARAQTSSAVFYGRGLTPGQTVTAWVGLKQCASTTVKQTGEWSIEIASNNACGPTNGTVVTFTVDGSDYESTPAAVWAPGGKPVDAINGYRLTKAAPVAVAVASSDGFITPTATSAPGSGQATATPTAAQTKTATATASATATTAMSPGGTPTSPKTGGAGLLAKQDANELPWILVTVLVVAGSGVVARRAYARIHGG